MKAQSVCRFQSIDALDAISRDAVALAYFFCLVNPVEVLAVHRGGSESGETGIYDPTVKAASAEASDDDLVQLLVDQQFGYGKPTASPICQLIQDDALPVIARGKLIKRSPMPSSGSPSLDDLPQALSGASLSLDVSRSLAARARGHLRARSLSPVALLERSDNAGLVHNEGSGLHPSMMSRSRARTPTTLRQVNSVLV